MRGDEDTEPHAKDPPDHRHDGELADYLIVISSRTDCCAHSKVPRFRFFYRVKIGRKYGESKIPLQRKVTCVNAFQTRFCALSMFGVRTKFRVKS
ncbi:hypothetical protein AK972_4262 [Pseudomonas yamanorum]|nr:hypothetical protein AK972_4262 [Pseudomonas yamanorum]